PAGPPPMMITSSMSTASPGSLDSDKQICQNGNMDAITEQLGRRLRTIRTQRGRTLAEVEDETGISVSTLSRLESGGRRATVDLLLPLARVYGVTLDELVGAPETGDPRVHIKPI